MTRLLSIVLVLAACGDNKLLPDARDRGDGSPTGDTQMPVIPRAVAVAGDFGSPGVGTVSKLELDSLVITQNLTPTAAAGDPVLRQYGDKLYIVNRFGSNNVTILDAKTFALEEQLSTGASSNPQDVAVVGNKLYVPAMGTAGVVVLTRGSTTTTTIDLSALDTQGADDGKPDCVSAYAVGTKVYVACGVLDNFNATENGKVAVIDTTTDTMTTSVVLPYRNPYGFFERAPETSTYTGDLLISLVPSFSNYGTGCVARISTGATPTASCGLTNAQLGGFANKLAVAPDGSLLWLAVGTYDTNFANPTGQLEGFDLASGMLWTAPVSATDQLIIDVTACPDGQVVATDQTLNSAGLRVWKDATERTTGPISIGMPPTSNALVCYNP